ncbi:MAG TPA: radical SAM protein [Candidatus Polarisedimenticolaceae bacterium]|nr:radical SAM protein [Candidatus Polarisedimenticolaceae bacterium]
MSLHLRGHTPASLLSARPDLVIDETLARRIIERVTGQGRSDLDGIRGLPKASARALAAEARLDGLTVVDRRASAVDPFVKYLFRAGDGALVETVRIPLEKPRFSVCVSSQAGCGLGCAFCETGRLGLTRSLEAWEIVEQVVAVKREAPADRPVTGVVFQGQGEPLQNYDAVMQAAAVMRDPNGLRIRGESITISTVGLVPAIERFADDGHVYRLILSLTSAIDAKRRSLVPIAATWPVAELARAMGRLADLRGGPVHLGWVLMAGVNTGDDEADAIVRAFEGRPVRLHAIDVNDPSGRFTPPDDVERGRFFEALRARGIAFVRRYSGGPDIHAACGMLASTAQGGRPA